MKRTILQSLKFFENATLPLKTKHLKKLSKLLRSFASDNSTEAHELRCRFMDIITKNDAAQFKKLVNRHDFLLKKMCRGRKLTDEEKKLIRTVDGLLNQH